MTANHLHAVSAEEAQAIALRAAALAKFSARYRHKRESQRTMLGALRRLARTMSDGTCDETTFPWEILTDEETAAQVWDSVAGSYAKRTASKDASALRIMLDCCRKVGLLSYEQYRHATSFEAKGGTDHPPAGHFLSENDVGTLTRSAGLGTRSPHTTARDQALLLTLASTGARGDEVANIDISQVNLAELRIRLLKTKSGAPRDAWLHPHAAVALERWIQFRGTAPGPLFVPLSRTRALVHRGPLSTHQVWKIVRRLAEEGGLAHITPHDLRRFVISTLLDHGVDLARVSKIVGHKDPATTAGYDRRPSQKMREAVAQINLPGLAESVP